MNESSRRGRPAPRFSRGRLPAAGVLLFVSAALIALGGLLLARSWKARTYHVNMLVDQAPTRALLATRIAAEGKKHGVDIKLSSRPFASLDALDLVDTPNDIDMALIPGGVALRSYPNARQVVALGLERLHLVARAELAEGGLARLKGRRINIGPPSTTYHYIGRDILAFAGLHAPPRAGAENRGRQGDYTAEELTLQELGQRLARIQTLSGADRERALGALPDGIFLIAALPSILTKQLVSVAGYRLVSFPFADAYCLDRISPPDAGEARIDRALTTATDIPAYTYGIDPAVPAVPCRTIATRLSMVAFEGTDPEAIARLVETVYDGPIARLTDPLPLRDQVPQFPFHRGTELYQERTQPFFSPELISNLSTLSGVVGAFASGIIAFYGFVRLRQLRRFETYYHEVRHIELIARGQVAEPGAPTDAAALRVYLEERLLDLKSQVVRDFAEGGLRGEGLMSGIVSLVNDTRSSLERLAPAGRIEPGITPARTPEELTSGKHPPDGRN